MRNSLERNQEKRDMQITFHLDETVPYIAVEGIPVWKESTIHFRIPSAVG